MSTRVRRWLLKGTCILYPTIGPRDNRIRFIWRSSLRVAWESRLAYHPGMKIIETIADFFRSKHIQLALVTGISLIVL